MHHSKVFKHASPKTVCVTTIPSTSKAVKNNFITPSAVQPIFQFLQNVVWLFFFPVRVYMSHLDVSLLVSFSLLFFFFFNDTDFLKRSG